MDRRGWIGADTGESCRVVFNVSLTQTVSKVHNGFGVESMTYTI